MKKVFLGIGGALILASVFPGIAWSSEKAPSALQAEFSEFYARFKAAVKANDAAAVADLAKLPFQNDPAVSTATEFKAKIYDESFTKQNRACLQRGKAVYDRDQENKENFLIFCYELIFVFTKTPAGFRFTDMAVDD